MRVTQTPDMAPGAVRLDGAGGATEISIARFDGGSPRYLDPRHAGADAWTAGECWFRPEPAPGGIGLGAAVTWQLKPHMPYQIRLRDETGAVTEMRVSWPVIRLPASAPPPVSASTVETDSGAEDPLAHFAEMAAAAPVQDPAPPVDPVTPPQPRRRSALLWVLPFLLVVLIGGVIGYFWVTEPERLAGFLPDFGTTETTETADPPAPARTLDAARAYVRSAPEAGAAAAEAALFADAGQSDGAFLILKYAARKGDAGALERLGDLYNPASFQPGGVIAAANADQAAVHYMEAAGKGTASALHKAGQLAKDGALGDATIGAGVRAALEAAADAGDEVARELIR